MAGGVEGKVDETETRSKAHIRKDSRGYSGEGEGGGGGGCARSLTQSEPGVAWQPLRVEIHIGVGCIPVTKFMRYPYSFCGSHFPFLSILYLSPIKDTWKESS